MEYASLADLMQRSAERVGEFSSEDQDTHAAKYALNPCKWVYDELGFELKGIQPDIMCAVAAGNDVAVRTGHKCGKSFVSACNVLFWLATRVRSKVLTTAPGERQLKHILWAEIGSLFRRWRSRHKFNITTGMHISHKDYPEEWFALGIYSNEADRIEGFHTREWGKLLILIDEAKAVDKTFFDAVASMQGQRIMTSVPPLNSQGYFYDAFTTQKELWTRFHQSSEDSPFVDPKWLAAREKDWIRGSVIWQAKIEGEFPQSSSSNLVIDPASVDKAQERFLVAPKASTFGKPAIGCDVARFGDDRTAEIVLRGNRLTLVDEQHGKDLMATVGRLIALAEDEAAHYNRHHRYDEGFEALDPKRIPIFVDDTGLGGGVTDRLAELEYNIFGINFAAKANNPRMYPNKRSELWFDLRDGMEIIELPPDDMFNGAAGRLAAELTFPQYGYTSEGVKLEPKDLIKKRLGRSPDLGDATCLGWAARNYAEVGDSLITIIG